MREAGAPRRREDRPPDPRDVAVGEGPNVKTVSNYPALSRTCDGAESRLNPRRILARVLDSLPDVIYPHGDDNDQ